MRILLIAYEFPPSPSPQSLRWTYLVRELDRLGHEVHVLTADLGGETPGLPALPDSVHVHRTFPGLLRGALAFHRDYRQRHPRRPRAAPAAAASAEAAHPAGAAASPGNAPVALRPPRNWKQRVSETVQAIAGQLRFPDIRGEWRGHGLRRLRVLMDRVRPDVVISSHEPATTLELGLAMRGRGVPWVADLGDPVLAPYTPRRWRARSWRLERAVFRHAAHVIVTNVRALEQMRERHGGDTPMSVLTQGFDLAPPAHAPPTGVFDSARLELLYTGSLYAFRRIDALLAALRADPRIRLSIAAVTVPEPILAAARAAPDQLRLLGFLPHRQALALQREADVLVNIANDDGAQIPGKFYEYLGAGRPVLHLAHETDLVAARIVALHRGWVCGNDEVAIADQLLHLLAAKQGGRLDAGLTLDTLQVREHSWQQLALGLKEVLAGVAGGVGPQSPDRASG
ncbi:glycosyltransferase [Luteimonas sp. M1R5S18]|uniref:Glycosyltransferase n=1 Tax=Luteimonas rhizosphaericola TaxID=3042024 RepID=A0ABT6JNZ9_9GAMM|nr:glycosyltransferase [Luteimonas rhizosphaericola]MDH5832198.1 glycosyltransferase [Luteimonas rhizosphaericola]